jgi:hypothetical protein
MSALLVTYDLVGSDATSENYKKLIQAIKGYGDWCRVQESVWIIATTDNSASVKDALKQHLHTTDRLFVGRLNGCAWKNPRCTVKGLQRVLAA